jgi:energy-coupling factor transporter transmembrane protein EcfT
VTDKPTRRELMKPIQLVGLAFGAALFAGLVTLISMGFFQDHSGEDRQRALITGLVVLGITFIVVLVSLALLLLTVDPAQVQKTIDRPVLLPDEPDEPEKPAAGDGNAPKP